MDKDGARRVRGEEVDRLSNLPESLLCEVLLNLPTKALVKCSVLSTRWRNLWKCVPVLDLGYEDFQEYDTFVSFVDSFLGFNSESCLQRFKLEYVCFGDDEPENGLISRWIDTVVKRKVEHLHVLDESPESWDLQMPQTLYTCESLVSLKLGCVTLTSPKFVSLPFLKVINLDLVQFADDLAFETLISQCPVLETLFIEMSLFDETEVLRVRSQSLLSFTYGSNGDVDFVEEFVVAIDAPRLKCLEISDGRTASFILNNTASLVEADIDTVFNLSFGKKFDPSDLLKRSMMRNFLVGISCVKDMTITSSTLEIIYDYSRCERLPLFRNLLSLRVKFYSDRWEMLPIFLESCPNLKSLVVGSMRTQDTEEGVSVISGPRCLLSSLEYVEVKRPLKGKAEEIKLASYLLENSKSSRN